MKITGSSIAMSSKTSSIEKHTKDESLITWAGSRRSDSRIQGNTDLRPLLFKLDILEISERAKALQRDSRKALTEIDDVMDPELDISDEDRQKILAIQKMIETLTGKKFKFYIPKKIKMDTGGLEPIAIPRQSQPAVRQIQRWGVDYQYHEMNYEQQKMSFSADGIIKTSDGREINISVQLNMSREFISSQDISFKAGDAKIDPLVINYGGTAPGLTETKFSFDLDSDGYGEMISFAANGSGLLALDKNSDGVINNGSELFGPMSGNGFEELDRYDSDDNGWIDENDPIYENLRIWAKDSNGTDKLFALGEKGVGAIYLGNIDTSFSIRDSLNNTEGEIRKTGIFVREDGSAGTINHIDLVI